MHGCLLFLFDNGAGFLCVLAREYFEKTYSLPRV